ncbi:hypothetical protein MY4824_001390 [Beauveria thailandica]
MRFIIMLGMAVGLAASAAAMTTPIERRQCSTQRDGCCLKQGHCETCYFGEEPYDCNCECLERGLCPCTGWYGKTGECFSWYSPDGHPTSSSPPRPSPTTKTTGRAQILGVRPGPPPPGLLVLCTTTTTTTGGPPPASLIINYWHYTGPATRENNVIMRGAALPDRQRFTQTTMPANEHDHSLGFLRHIRGNDGRGAPAFPEPHAEEISRSGSSSCRLCFFEDLGKSRLRRRDMRRRPGPALADYVSGIMAGITTTGNSTFWRPSRQDIGTRPHIANAVFPHSQDISRGGRSSRAAITPACALPLAQRDRQKPNDDDRTGVGTAGSVPHVVHLFPPPSSQAGPRPLYDQNTGTAPPSKLKSSPAGSGISGNTTHCQQERRPG